ncbi:Rgr1p Ecym_1527 [Eremothecium cymbalariae DBVPG|uniref:Mediator of RNA polymerase II transcription subunit 14 n=1 Tax=Eremothecium cymbalariae (strain CBS 270.75 / DBVPG 7215 / KCTC 17166 / NRRL Y-17582) TaxID=931890 RepID=G8JMT3_ERECY|nr:hypothetical protein Ecym_1527 [Eremothecium cymbalariae DBVPG\
MTTAVKESKLFRRDFDTSKPSTMTKASGISAEVSQGQQHQRIITPVKEAPPPLPHVDFNQLPLAVIIRNLTVYAVKELSLYMKTNVHSTEDPTTRKMGFLKLIIFLRNQFLRIYVLIKWCKTIKQNNFHTMIDLLNWFRGTNVIVNNCLLALKDTSTNMAGAKLPNPDLITALEVLMLGRPNLPTHDFVLNGDDSSNQSEKIPAKLILKRLRDLNTCLSIKISLMDLPPEFHSYSIKNGRITFVVSSEFEISLSTIDQDSPLFFVNIKFLFNDNRFPLNTTNIERIINDILFRSQSPLLSLYQFIHKYVLTLQLYMIHVELQDMETNGKYAAGNLLHHYDSKKNMITLRYWLQSKMNSKCKATIGVERETQSIILKWQTPDIKGEMTSTKYNNLLGNMEAILDEITFNHARIIRSELLVTGLFQNDESKSDDSDSLLFHVPVICVATAPVQLKINPISGIFYFRNPSSLLLSYAKLLNQTSNLEEFTNILERLRMDKIVHILRNMFEKTGWICKDVVKLNKPILYEKRIKDQKKILTRDLFIRLKDWPANWFFILSLVSSGATCMVEKIIGKVKSIKGNWELKYLDQGKVQVVKLESITYQNVMHMQKTIIQKILNHMIIDSLNELKISKAICQGDGLQKLPYYVEDGVSNVSNVSIIAIALESFLQGSKALSDTLENTMFLRMDYEQNEIKLFGKFKKDTQMIRCQCDELLVNFIDKKGLAFHMSEKFTNLSHVVQYLNRFRQKLMQLVILTDVTEKLHRNFKSEYFQIVKLKPNEISFKYLKNSKDEQDCTIQIVTNDTKIEKLQVELSRLNPQHIIQKYLECDKYDPHFIFNYLHFTSRLFSAFTKILESSSNTMNVTLHLHTLAGYQLNYHNRLTGGQVALSIDLRNFPHKSGSLYYVHFAHDDHISTKNPMYALVLQVINTIFILSNGGKKTIPNAIRLGVGVACTSNDIEPLLGEIHSVLTHY